jgi:hypothetical protein
VAQNSAGAEHAWVIWSAPSIGAVPKTVVQMRRLNRLDAADGPVVGPLVTLVSATTPAASEGVARADLAFEPQTDGPHRGVVTWLSRTGPGANDVMVAWLNDLDRARPSLVEPKALFTASADRGPTLEADASGTRLLVRGPTGKLQLFAHAAGAPLDEWQPGAAGVDLASQQSRYPAATLLDSGETIAVIESNTTEEVLTVQRWSADGVSVVTTHTLTGYREPTITSDGVRAWVIAVRVADGAIVSRRVAGATAEPEDDDVELASHHAPAASYPNALRRIDERMVFVVRGLSESATRSSVLSFQRRI